MCNTVVRKLCWLGCLITLLLARTGASASSVNLAWDPSPDTDVVGYFIYYGGSSQTYTNRVAVGNVTTATIESLTAGGTYYFAATAMNAESLESEFSNEAIYTVPMSTNAAPTLNPIANVTIPENAPVQTVALSGISSGSTLEAQVLSVAAISSLPTLIPNPTVSYISPATTGSISFAPRPGVSGVATITVTVNDGGAGNNQVQKQFQVTVTPLNRPPTISQIEHVVLEENSGPVNVALSGISSGSANEIQTLQVTAMSSDPALLPHPVVNYTSPSANGSLVLTPKAGASGEATVTVTVSDGQAANGFVQSQFLVVITAANRAPTLSAIANLSLPENAGPKTVSLSGISSGSTNEAQVLRVTAVSSNPALIPTPVVAYTSPSTSGTLTLSPTAGMSGEATITVTVSDGQTVNATVQRSFLVAVSEANRPPTIDPIADLFLDADAPVQTVALSGISAGAAGESQTLTITAISSLPSVVPNPVVNYTSPSSTGSLIVSPVAGVSGEALITVTVNDGQSTNPFIQRQFLVMISAANKPPTLNPLTDLTLVENAGLQTVPLSGISSGSSTEIQVLKVTAVSSNPGLIPSPTVQYTSPASTGSIFFTPVAGASGQCTITLTVNDGEAINGGLSRQFVVTVTPENRPPTLNALADVLMLENSGPQAVSLSGISAGAAAEVQTLRVTAVSSNPSLLPNPAVSYSSPSATGTLTLSPVANGSGTAVVVVTVDDGQAVNHRVERQFTVTVTAGNRAPTLDPIADVNLLENSLVQTVELTGITAGSSTESQSLKVRAYSSDPSLVSNPVVAYVNPANAGSMTFTVGANLAGAALVTVEVDDGQPHNNLVRRTFTVTVERVVADVSFSPSAVQASQIGLVPVDMLTTQPAREVTVTFEAPPEYFTNVKLQDLAPEVGVSSVSLGALPGSISTMLFKCRANKLFVGDSMLGNLSFTVSSDRPSSFVNLRVVRIAAKLADGTQVIRDVNYSTRIAVVSEQPLLELEHKSDGSRSLTLYGKPTATYGIEYSQTGASGPWLRLPGEVRMNSMTAEVSNLTQTGNAVFYRSVQVR